MKKAKITLGAIAILAIIGSSIAWKSSKVTSGLTLYVTTEPGGVATETYFHAVRTVLNEGDPFYTTTELGTFAGVDLTYLTFNVE